jgi:lysine-specific permease
LVGLCASEVSNPKKAVPKAIKGTFWGLSSMFVLSIMFMGLNIVPADLNPETKLVSPFLVAFKKVGVPYADHFFNFICLISVISAGNSSVYATSRILVGLAEEGAAPSFLLLKMRNGSPYIAVLINVALGSLSYLTSLFGNGVVFDWLIFASGLSAILSWLCISVTHLRFRAAYVAQGKNISDLPYKTFWHPASDIFSIVILSSVVLLSCGMGFFPGGDVKKSLGCLCGVFLMFALYVGHKAATKVKLTPLIECNMK